MLGPDPAVVPVFQLIKVVRGRGVCVCVCVCVCLCVCSHMNIPVFTGISQRPVGTEPPV